MMVETLLVLGWGFFLSFSPSLPRVLKLDPKK